MAAGRKQTMVCLADFETYAERHLSSFGFAFYSGGAEREITARNNRKAYTRFYLKPRVLRGVSQRTQSTMILGSTVDIPIALSPTAMHGLAHPEGEVATAAAASKMNALMIMSSVSTRSMEDIVRHNPTGTKWLNIYIWPDRDITADMVKRAERLGIKAIVVSVDIPVVSIRRPLNREGGLPKDIKIGNFEKYFLKSPGSTVEVPTVFHCCDPALTWRDITWLKSITKLPIVLKGILNVEDAVLAVQHGVDGILVSNHGGRQLDGTPATIDVLADIVQAVGDKVEVYVDGGVRQGTDVFKALALGARAVFIGQPVVYGLAYKGAEGVEKVLQILKDELDVAMALSGCTKLSDITPSLVTRIPHQSNL